MLQQQLEAIEAENNPDVDAAATGQNILDTQGALQLANAGNFGQSNQEGTRPNNAGSGPSGTVVPKKPGSVDDANLIARQFREQQGVPR